MEVTEVSADTCANSSMKTVVSLSYECQLKESQIQATNQEISTLQQEVEKLMLERQWCFDADSKRIIPSAEQQALHLSQQIAAHPEIMEDIVKALRMKRIDLQCNLKELQQRCKALKEQIK